MVIKKLLKSSCIICVIFSTNAYSEVNQSQLCKSKSNVPDYAEFNFSVNHKENLINEDDEDSDETIFPYFYGKKDGYKLSTDCSIVGQIEAAAGYEIYRDREEQDSELLALNLGAYYSFLKLDNQLLSTYNNGNNRVPYSMDAPKYNAIGLHLIPIYRGSEDKKVTTRIIYTLRNPFDLSLNYSDPNNTKVKNIEIDFDFILDRNFESDDEDDPNTLENNRDPDNWVVGTYLELEYIKDFTNTNYYLPATSFGFNINYRDDMTNDEQKTTYGLFYRWRRALNSGDDQLGDEISFEPYINYQTQQDEDSLISYGINFIYRWYQN